MTNTNKGLWDGECFTPGCSATGAGGMSLVATAPSPSGQGNDTHRCGRCLDAISLLVPDVPNRLSELNLIDKTTYGQWCQRVAAMSKAELFNQAALMHRRLRAAYEAAVWLMEATGSPALARDHLATLATATDLLGSEITIINWWAAHCHGSRDVAACGPDWFALPPDVDGPADG
jgi:hypothetical protein